VFSFSIWLSSNAVRVSNILFSENIKTIKICVLKKTNVYVELNQVIRQMVKFSDAFELSVS
jgi:hypothetical protein